MILATKLEEKNIIWSMKPRGDKVFFDYKHKLLVFVRDNMMEFLPFYPTDFSLPNAITVPEPNNKNKDFGLNFEGIEIRSVGLSFTLKIFVISRKPNLIEFFDPLSLNRTVLYKLPPASKLILFDWVRKSKTCNFFSVSTGGIQMFFIDENSMSLKKGPGVNTAIVNAWYDGVRQFLAVSFLESPAELKIFDLNKTDEGINFKSPTHVLTLNLSATDGHLPAFNTNSYYERSKKTEESNSTVVIDFINLYKECYILHIDSESGSLDLHEIGGSSIKTVKILAESSHESKTGRFRYNIVDNLLVIHYLLEQITSVIDVRKDAGAQVVFGAPSCLSFMIEDIVANDLMNFCNYFDDKQIEFILDDQATINLDTNLTINTNKKIITGLSVDLKEVLKSAESDSEKFCFLFRRSKSKQMYTGYLRELITDKEKISSLRPMFNKVLENYRTAKNEMYSQSMMKLTMSSISIDSYQKLKSGESFLKLKEFQDEVINPITMNFFINTESENYFLKAVMCFVNISLEKKIQIEPQIEDLLLKLFIKTKKFLVMHQIIQNSVLTDRLQIAIVLCELGSMTKKPLHEGSLNSLLDIFIAECLAYMGDCYYMPAFQIGIDMLNRVRHQNTSKSHAAASDEFKLYVENLIFTYHIRNFKLLECIEMLETKHIKLSMTNLESLLVASNDPRSNYSFRRLLNYFGMKQTRERLLGSTEKFDDIVNRIIKQTAFIKALTLGND